MSEQTNLERAKVGAAPAEAEKEPRDEQERDYGATMYQLGRKHMREELEPRLNGVEQKCTSDEGGTVR